MKRKIIAMQLQITLNHPDMKKNAAMLRTFADMIDGKVTEEQTTSAIDVSEIKKSKKASKKAEEEEVTEPESDLGFDDPAAMTDGSEFEEEEEKQPPKKAAKTFSLDDDIIPAFQAYAKKHSREAAGKILAKYKVKSVRDLAEGKYGEVMKLLGA